MNKFTINKAIISDSKVTLILNQSVEDDFIERLEHYFRVIDETNHIMKNSFFGNYNPNTNKTNNNNNKTNNKMETRNISITLEEAKEWYNSNIILKDIALKAFTKEELESSFRDIKSFKDACDVLNISFDANSRIADMIASTSKASAAMFKVNIIRKALNLGQDLYLTKGSYLHRPCNPFISKISPCYSEDGSVEIIGEVECEGIKYKVVNSMPHKCDNTGLTNYSCFFYTATTSVDTAFLGCATKEIAKHFGKYFGMLISEAKYGDLPGFKIINNKYNN